MQRREFIQRSSAALAAGMGAGMNACAKPATVQEMDQAVSAVGQLPRRKLGYSKREVSVMVGAGDWAPDAVEAGVRCGVNFWHKATEWPDGAVPKSILKNREAHYCTICVDRVGGNHERGTHRHRGALPARQRVRQELRPGLLRRYAVSLRLPQRCRSEAEPRFHPRLRSPRRRKGWSGTCAFPSTATTATSASQAGRARPRC